MISLGAVEWDMRRLFVSLAVCSLVACQKHPSYDDRGINLLPPGVAPSVKQMTAAEGNALAAQNKACWVPMKSSRKVLAVVTSPTQISFYRTARGEDTPYFKPFTTEQTLYFKTMVEAVPGKEGPWTKAIGSDGTIHAGPDVLEAMEFAVLNDWWEEIDGRVMVNKHEAFFVPTADGNPRGGLVYEMPEGYTYLYRYNPKLKSYWVVDEVPHIRVNGFKVDDSLWRVKQLQARLAEK